MRTPRALRAALLVLAVVNAVSALAGMAGLILGDGMGLPRSALAATPFGSWVWPAIILGVVVGGAQLLAAVAQVRRLSLAWGLHAASGLVLVIRCKWTKHRRPHTEGKVREVQPRSRHGTGIRRGP